MKVKIYIYDPTVNDPQSKVRGIGRYLQILRENFQDDWIFTNNLATLSSKLYSLSSVFINPFFNFLQKPLTMKRIAKKQIAVIHDLIPLKYPNHFPVGIKGNINVLLNKLVLRNYDLVVTDSEYSKKDIIRILRLPEKKIKVIYPCLPKQFTNKELRIKNNELKQINIHNSKFIIPNSFCLYVGDATWNKNLVNLARAIRIIDVPCVFIGKVFEQANSQEFRRLNKFKHPWQKEFRRFVEEVNKDKRFIFPGFVTDKELIKYYKQATVNVLPSRDEGYGFSYVEAGSQTCPSVLSDIPIFHEIAKDSSLFCDPENPEDIAEKIKKIFFNELFKFQFGEKAKKRSDYFSREKFKQNFMTIIES